MPKILIGIDIGTQTIKAVQMQKEKSGNTLLAAGYIQNPVQNKTLPSISQNDEQSLSKAINRLIHDMKVSTTDVSASLSSSKVITRIIGIPSVSDKELDSSIQWEAEQYIPWPLSKTKIDYEVIEKDENMGKMKILLVAAPITVIEQQQNIITQAGLNVIALETEILAAARSMVESLPSISNFIITNFGAGTTEVGIIHQGVLEYSKSFPIGGTTLTKAISDDLGFDIAQAEEYKRTYGLEEDKLEGKIAKIISPYMTSVYDELIKTVAFFHNEHPGEDINSVILTGGTAKLPGLVMSVTQKTGLDSQVSNPFLNIKVDPNIAGIISPDAQLYTTAVGLALKDT